MALAPTLYEKLNMKRKYSIFKSVFITGSITLEGYPLVEVEPYDDTFLNAINTSNKYDKVLDRIFKAVFDYYNQKDVWVAVYTDRGHEEFLLSEYSMKKVYKLI